MIRYEQMLYLQRLLQENYKSMTQEDYNEIKTKLEKVASDKIDDVFRKVFGK